MVCDYLIPLICNHLSCCCQKTYGPDFFICIAWCKLYLPLYITYISVSMPSPWAVTSPNGQLVSDEVCALSAADSLHHRTKGQFRTISRLSNTDFWHWPIFTIGYFELRIEDTLLQISWENEMLHPCRCSPWIPVIDRPHKLYFYWPFQSTKDAKCS